MAAHLRWAKDRNPWVRNITKQLCIRWSLDILYSMLAWTRLLLMGVVCLGLPPIGKAATTSILMIDKMLQLFNALA